jgi:RNA polymerase sigma factor (sigma-70 family)
MPVGEDPSTLLGNSTDGLGERREDAMDALAALAYLPEKQRVAVTLRYLQDLPYAEIARITGWPESTAKTLVRRGLIRLRDLLILEDSEDGDAR